MKALLATVSAATLALAALSAQAIEFGINCTPTNPGQCPTGPSLVATLQATHSAIWRMRGQVPRLVYDGATYGTGTPSFVIADVDPLQQTADTTDCPGFSVYPIQVSSVSQFTVGDTVVSDFYNPASSPVVCKIAAPTIYVTAQPTVYLSTVNFVRDFGTAGNNGNAALVHAAGIDLEWTAFNPVNPGAAADGPILDQTGAVCTTSACDTMYQTRVAYVFSLVPIKVATQGNEETGSISVSCNGGPSQSLSNSGYNGYLAAQAACTGFTIQANGDWGDLSATTLDTDMHAQIQKQHDLCLVAHNSGSKCGDSGAQINAFQAAYLDYLWNDCFTPSQLVCRQMADINQQWGYGRNFNQAEFSGNLITSCQYPTGGPPYLTGGAAKRAAREESLIADDANVGLQYADYPNLHWYYENYQGMVPAIQHFEAVTGKPFMVDEAAPYTPGAPDMMMELQGAGLSNVAFFLHWNEGAYGVQSAVLSGPYSCSSSCNPAQVPIFNQTGGLWNAYLTGQAPQMITGTAPPQPFC